MSLKDKHDKFIHNGHDYGKAFRCNRLYNQSYGKYGRKRLHSELRIDDKVKAEDGEMEYFNESQ